MPRTTATYSYRAMGLALDIHVSDLGAAGIADGTTSSELARRFEATKKALVAATEVHNLQAARRHGAARRAAMRARCAKPSITSSGAAKAARRICGSRPCTGS